MSSTQRRDNASRHCGTEESELPFASTDFFSPSYQGRGIFVKLTKSYKESVSFFSQSYLGAEVLRSKSFYSEDLLQCLSMSIVADLHMHSSFARACSKDLNFQNNSSWAKLKGINLLSSADFTHPVWWEETKKTLKEKGNGFYSYNGVDFVLGGEVSVIYSQGGKLRRVHLLLFAPDMETVEKINGELGKRGKLGSDGRPILGLTSQNIAQIMFEAHPDSLIIPAHAWTPWFGIYGANSGFDSLEECFGEYTDKILAIETGLSSDPFMNWQVEELDNKSIVSFSDAHSLPKMGRELTVFRGKSRDGGNWGYGELVKALKNQEIDYTLEFYPEEGKYHFTGHRNCNIKLTPEETATLGDTCSVCKRRLTGGVLYRVNQLAKRTESDLKMTKEGLFKKSTAFPRPPYVSLVSLIEIIGEALGRPVTSPKVKEEFFKLVKTLSNELDLLTKMGLEEIQKVTHPRVVEGISRVRNGEIVIDPGYDGLYGIVKIWPETPLRQGYAGQAAKTKPKDGGQMELFG